MATYQLWAPIDTINFLINNKRENIILLEKRFQIKIQLHADSNFISPHYSVDSVNQDKKIGKSQNKIEQKTRRKIDREKTENINESKSPSNSVIAGERDDGDDQKRKKRRKRKEDIRRMLIPKTNPKNMSI